MPLVKSLTRVCICAAFAASLAHAAPIQAEPPKPEAPPEFPKFEEAMKDFTQVPVIDPEGGTPLFTLWQNKKTDSLRAQIPAGSLGQQFLIASSMSGGPVATGFQMDHFLAYFERMNKQLVLMRVDPRFVEGRPDNPMADVIKRSYGGNEIFRTSPIITLNGQDPVIDLDGLFKADFVGIGGWFGGLNPGLSKWAKTKIFPGNIELSVDLAFMQGQSGRRMLFHYSLSKIPATAEGYQPRVADDRVGYFMTVRKDWNKEHASSTMFNRYICRWRLEKRDPNAELSAPKNPIVWYIEKTVPLQYRRWVKEGILEWNKAYEKCGFLDAIEVKQQEDYNEAAKFDPEDARYNFFRWIVTGRGFAMGPSRDHPLTGQIFDADIVFDDAMVRHYVTDYERLTGGEQHWDGFNPILDEFFRANPQWVYRTSLEKLIPSLRLRDDPDEAIRRSLMTHMRNLGRPMCECAAGMARQLDFAGLAMEARGLGRNNEEFIGQIIKEIVMHEVGHCLGLRHNFKASTWLTMKEIEEHNKGGDPNVGSVMDYNPPIVCPRGNEQGSFTTRSIGPYDYWAIEYGYRPAGKPHKDEAEMLKSIGARVAEAGLDYATDEDTMGILSPDPLSNRFDMGADVMEYAAHQIKLTGDLMKDIEKWAVKDGESYSKLRRAFRRVFGERARATSFVARYVGGQIVNRDHKGDKDCRASVVPVDAKKQKAALKFVCEQVFAENAYQVNPELLAKLAPGRFGHWDSDDYDFRQEFLIHELVSGAQFQCLLTLMNPFTIERIHDNQVKFGEDDDVFSLAHHIRETSAAIWSELDDGDRKGTDKKPYINSYRRNLQRMHLDMLMNLVLSEPNGAVPADANALARLSVDGLSKKIGKVLGSGDLDDATKAHLTDVKKRIDKALEAQYMVGGAGGGIPFFFFREAARNQPADSNITVLPER